MPPPACPATWPLPTFQSIVDRFGLFGASQCAVEVDPATGAVACACRGCLGWRAFVGGRDPAAPFRHYEVLTQEHVRGLAAYLRERARAYALPSPRILEVGAGSGRLSYHLRRCLQDLEGVPQDGAGSGETRTTEVQGEGAGPGETTKAEVSLGGTGSEETCEPEVPQGEGQCARRGGSAPAPPETEGALRRRAPSFSRELEPPEAATKTKDPPHFQIIASDSNGLGLASPAQLWRPFETGPSEAGPSEAKPPAGVAERGADAIWQGAEEAERRAGGVSGNPVLHMDAEEAVQLLQPHFIVCCWMPLGVDWSASFRAQESVREYILVGEKDTGVCGHPRHTWGFPCVRLRSEQARRAACPGYTEGIPFGEPSEESPGETSSYSTSGESEGGEYEGGEYEGGEYEGGQSGGGDSEVGESGGGESGGGKSSSSTGEAGGTHCTGSDQSKQDRGEGSCCGAKRPSEESPSGRGLLDGGAAEGGRRMGKATEGSHPSAGVQSKGGGTEATASKRGMERMGSKGGMESMGSKGGIDGRSKRGKKLKLSCSAPKWIRWDSAQLSRWQICRTDECWSSQRHSSTVVFRNPEYSEARIENVCNMNQ